MMTEQFRRLVKNILTGTVFHSKWKEMSELFSEKLKTIMTKEEFNELMLEIYSSQNSQKNIPYTIFQRAKLSKNSANLFHLSER